MKWDINTFTTSLSLYVTFFSTWIQYYILCCCSHNYCGNKLLITGVKLTISTYGFICQAALLVLSTMTGDLPLAIAVRAVKYTEINKSILKYAKMHNNIQYLFPDFSDGTRIVSRAQKSRAQKCIFPSRRKKSSVQQITPFRPTMLLEKEAHIRELRTEMLLLEFCTKRTVLANLARVDLPLPGNPRRRISDYC